MSFHTKKGKQRAFRSRTFKSTIKSKKLFKLWRISWNFDISRVVWKALQKRHFLKWGNLHHSIRNCFQIVIFSQIKRSFPIFFGKKHVINLKKHPKGKTRLQSLRKVSFFVLQRFFTTWKKLILKIVRTGQGKTDNFVSITGNTPAVLWEWGRFFGCFFEN